MNLLNRLQKLEQTQLKTQSVIAITISGCNEALLSTGEVVNREDLLKQRQLLALYEIGEAGNEGIKEVFKVPGITVNCSTIAGLLYKLLEKGKEH